MAPAGLSRRIITLTAGSHPDGAEAVPMSLQTGQLQRLFLRVSHSAPQRPEIAALLVGC